jgi:hypothetical protein
MEMKLLTHVDPRDKILKLLGSLAKVTAQFADPGRAKDSAALTLELGRARKWLKFLRLLRSIRKFPDSIASDKIPVLNRMENLADAIQMITEDLHTLNRSGVWSGLLGFEKIQGIAELEDQAWFVWSALAAYNAGSDLKAAIDEKADQTRLIAASLAFLKFSCEVGDSLIALTPAEAKKGREKQFIVASAILGSVSAACSLHKFVTSS